MSRGSNPGAILQEVPMNWFRKMCLKIKLLELPPHLLDANELSECLCLSRVNTWSFSLACSFLYDALMPHLTGFDTSTPINTRSTAIFIDSSSAVWDYIVRLAKSHYTSLISQENIKKTYSTLHPSLCLLMELGNLHDFWWPRAVPV